MSDQAPTAEPIGILKPFTPDPDRAGRKLRRRILLGLFFLFCWFWGVAFAFLAPFLILFFVFPLVVLLVLCIWALPEETPPPLKAMTTLFFAFLVVKVLWPDYLAIDLVVLPWITVARLVAFPLTLLFLISLSVSRTFRSEIGEVVRASPLIVTALVAFNVIQLITLPLSNALILSFDHLYVDEVNWYVMFFVAAWVFRKPGQAERWTLILWLMAIPVTLLAIGEAVRQKPLWAGHIPGFLKISDPSVQMVLAGFARSYTGRYRSIATFTTPLGLAEYYAISAPFVMHVLLNDYPRKVKRAAYVAGPMIMIGVFLTNARLGSIGLLAGIAVYSMVWSLNRRRWEPGNVVADVISWGYPVLFAGVLAVTLFVGRVRRIVWGGGETQASTDGRKMQLQMAKPIILHNPIGHGVATGAEVLGFREPGGLLTIDSYVLSILIEYGVIGFIVFYGMFAWTAARSLREGMATPTARRELNLLLPTGVALIVFMIIKSVFSEEGNHPLLFILLGMCCALFYRIRMGEARLTAPAPEVQAPAIQGGGPRRPLRPAIRPATS